MAFPVATGVDGRAGVHAVALARPGYHLAVSTGIDVRIGGRTHRVPVERLDDVEPIVRRCLVDGGFNAPIPADEAEAFGRALFGAESWPAIVEAVADAAELGAVIRATYFELAVASGRLGAPEA